VENVLDRPPDGQPAVREELVKQGVTSTAYLPLLHKEDIIGILYVNLTVPHRFSQNDKLILELFASQAAIAIENARLFKDTRESAAKLFHLRRIGQDIASALELDDVLEIIANCSIQLTKADKALILVVDEQELQTKVGAGFAPEQIENFTYQEVQDGISGWVLREGKPTISDDILTDPRNTGIAFQRAREERERGKSIAVAPLSVKEKIIGTLTVINNVERPVFNQGDLDLVAMLANQAAIAIDNARLFEQRQKLLEQTQELLNRVQASRVSELEAQSQLVDYLALLE
jgi:GAF domain-containing protein